MRDKFKKVKENIPNIGIRYVYTRHCENSIAIVGEVNVVFCIAGFKLKRLNISR